MASLPPPPRQAHFTSRLMLTKIWVILFFGVGFVAAMISAATGMDRTSSTFWPLAIGLPLAAVVMGGCWFLYLNKVAKGERHALAYWPEATASVVEFDYVGQNAAASGSGWVITLVIPGDSQPQRRAYIGKKQQFNPGDTVDVIFDPNGSQTDVYAIDFLRYAALGPGPGAIG